MKYFEYIYLFSLIYVKNLYLMHWWFFVSHCFLFCFVFRVTFYFSPFKQFFFFLSSFRFSAKLKNYRDSQYPSCCNVCRTSLFSKIPHQNGTLVATEQPTLTHPYHTEPIVYLRIHVYLLCSLWIWTNVKRQVFTVIVSYRVVLLPWKSSLLYLFIFPFILAPLTHRFF